MNIDLIEQRHPEFGYTYHRWSVGIDGEEHGFVYRKHHGSRGTSYEVRDLTGCTVEVPGTWVGFETNKLRDACVERGRRRWSRGEDATAGKWQDAVIALIRRIVTERPETLPSRKTLDKQRRAQEARMAWLEAAEQAKVAATLGLTIFPDGTCRFVQRCHQRLDREPLNEDAVTTAVLHRLGLALGDDPAQAGFNIKRAAGLILRAGLEITGDFHE